MANNVPDDSLRETLTEVRTAYRLLAAYTQSILDVAKQIAETAGTPEFLWATTDTDRRQSTNENLMGSARHFVPVYHEFSYVISRSENDLTPSPNWLLTIWHRGDSGFASLDETAAPHPDRFESSPGDCSTDLYLAAFVPTENIDHPDWRAIYENVPWPNEVSNPGKNPHHLHGRSDIPFNIENHSPLKLGIWGCQYQIRDFSTKTILQETVTRFLRSIPELNQ